MTVKMLREKAKAIGMVYRRDSHWQIHIVDYPKAIRGGRDTRYETADAQDALDTMIYMADRKPMEVSE